MTAYEYTDGTIRFVCETCDSSVEHWCGAPYNRSLGSRLRKAARAAVEDGWKLFPDERGEWVHYCPDCEPPRRTVGVGEFPTDFDDPDDDLMEDPIQ